MTRPAGDAGNRDPASKDLAYDNDAAACKAAQVANEPAKPAYAPRVGAHGRDVALLRAKMTAKSEQGTSAKQGEAIDAVAAKDKNDHHAQIAGTEVAKASGVPDAVAPAQGAGSDVGAAIDPAQLQHPSRQTKAAAPVPAQEPRNSAPPSPKPIRRLNQKIALADYIPIARADKPSKEPAIDTVTSKRVGSEKEAAPGEAPAALEKYGAAIDPPVPGNTTKSAPKQQAQKGARKGKSSAAAAVEGEGSTGPEANPSPEAAAAQPGQQQQSAPASEAQGATVVKQEPGQASQLPVKQEVKEEPGTQAAPAPAANGSQPAAAAAAGPSAQGAPPKLAAAAAHKAPARVRRLGSAPTQHAAQAGPSAAAAAAAAAGAAAAQQAEAAADGSSRPVKRSRTSNAPQEPVSSADPADEPDFIDSSDEEAVARAAARRRGGDTAAAVNRPAAAAPAAAMPAAPAAAAAAGPAGLSAAAPTSQPPQLMFQGVRMQAYLLPPPAGGGAPRLLVAQAPQPLPPATRQVVPVSLPRKSAANCFPRMNVRGETDRMKPQWRSGKAPSAKELETTADESGAPFLCVRGQSGALEWVPIGWVPGHHKKDLPDVSGGGGGGGAAAGRSLWRVLAAACSLQPGCPGDLVLEALKCFAACASAPAAWARPHPVTPAAPASQHLPSPCCSGSTSTPPRATSASTSTCAGSATAAGAWRQAAPASAPTASAASTPSTWA